VEGREHQGSHGLTAWDRRRFLQFLGAGATLTVTGGLLAACSGDDPEPGTTGGVTGGATGGTTAMTWLSPTPGPDFIEIPAYIAQELGYYEAEGLDITTEYPGSSSRAAQLLSAGQANLALPEPSFVLSSVDSGNDVRSVWVLGNGSFFGMAVLNGSPIHEWSAETVRGSRIGISEFAGGEIPLLRGALALIGVKESEVELVVVGDGGAEAADAIESGDIDIYSTGDVGFALLAAAGVDLVRITPDIVAGFPRLTAMVQGEYLTSNRNAVLGWCRAWNKGIVFMNANPTAAAVIAKQYAPENLGETSVEDVQQAFVEALLLRGLTPYFDPQSDVFQKIGMQDLQGWDDYMNYLIKAGADSDEGVRLTRPVDLSKVVTNELVDEANDFDYASIEKEAAEYE
jgi:NitT/TauT family transport system substrate-binding protein